MDFEYTADLAGEERWFRAEMIAAPRIGVVVTHTDITGERLARAGLESLIRGGDELIASVSHELRTPLSASLG